MDKHKCKCQEHGEEHCLGDVNREPKYWYLVIGIDETWRKSFFAYGPFKTKEEADDKDAEARAKVEHFDGAHWFHYATMGFESDQGIGRLEGAV